MRYAFKASVLIALAFSLPSMASPLDAQYAQRGYEILVQRGAIIPTSNYSRVLRDAIALIKQGQSIDEVSRRTGVNIRVLEKILRLGTPIPAVDPKTVIQATIPVPNPPPIEIAATPEVALKPKLKPKLKPRPKPIAISRKKPAQRKAKTAKKTVLASGPKLVEGYGMGSLDSGEIVVQKKFKYKFRVVKDFLNDRPERPVKQAASIPEERLSPSQRALLDIQKRYRKTEELEIITKE